jgi:Cu-processing system ATP-binding protein
MIELKNVRKSFRKREVLRGVSLSFAPGRITGILGPNACGKTTLMKSILGLVVPDSGEILVAGSPVRDDPDYRARIGYMPQAPALPENLRVGEILDLLEDLRKARAPRREELIRRLELNQTLARPFGELSGGMKQRVAATIALMFDPPALILDEPTASLDPMAAVLLRQIIREEGEAGKTVIVISHSAAEIEELTAEIVFMLDGKISYSGSLRQLTLDSGSRRLDEALVRLFRPCLVGDTA